MFIFAAVIAFLLVGLALLQVAFALHFCFHIARQTSDREHQPTGLATVLVSVRGCDPSLKQSLIRLLDQDYPDYEIQMVVDHCSDEAWRVVHEIKEEFDISSRLTIHEMREPLETCGLKCSSMIQAYEATNPDSKYIVLLDADVMPHPTWLSDVVRPLKDPNIGVVTGNQWFEANGSGNPGTLIRSLWNAGAIVPTAIHANPWAGTCAMRLEDFQAAGLDLIWRESVVDDGPIRAAFAPLGLKMHFEPSLIMVNRERCTFDYVGRYVTRMLTWSKLHEKTFVNTVVYAIISTFIFLAALTVLMVGLVQQQYPASLLAALAILLSSAFSMLAYLIVRNGVEHNTKKHNENLPKLSLGRIGAMVFLIPVTQLIFCISCAKAIVARQVQWREITYEVKGKSDVRMLQYQPMSAREPEFAQSELSI